jgi:NADPH-dependent curcumin reductase CurA
MELTNKYIVIKHHIEDAPKESHFEIKSEAIGLSLEPGSDDVIVKNLYISIDPYLINRMKSQSASHNAISFATPLIPGQVRTLFVLYKNC